MCSRQVGVVRTSRQAPCAASRSSGSRHTVLDELQRSSARGDEESSALRCTDRGCVSTSSGPRRGNPWRLVFRGMAPVGGWIVSNNNADGAFALYGAGIGVIAPFGIWAEASTSEYFPYGTQRTVLGGYAFGYHVEPGSWNLSVPVFAGYRYAEARTLPSETDHPSELDQPSEAYLKMITAGARAAWSYDTLTHDFAVEVGVGLLGAWTLSRRADANAGPPIRYWVEVQATIGFAVE